MEKSAKSAPMQGLHEYDLGDLVGSGSSAQVYWARKHTSGELVAIKVLDKLQHSRIRTQSKSMSKTNQIQEIELQMRLDHPNILKILHVFEDQRNAYIVLEPCLHGSLVSLRERAPLDESIVRHYVKGILAGLELMHSQNILHRDLKLSNILLTEEDDVKIADFGLAIDLNVNNDPDTICGTPNFIAPEIILGKPYSFAADLWSLGCIVYSLFAGKAPFQGQNVVETLQNIGTGASIEIPIDVTDHAKDFLQRLLSVDPLTRTTCTDLLKHAWLQQENRLDASNSKKSVNTRSQGPSGSKHLPNLRQRRRKKATARLTAQNFDSSMSSDESEKDSESTINDESDPDIAQLETLLGKIQNRPIHTLTHDPEISGPVDVAPPIRNVVHLKSFVVQYHSILDADESHNEIHCELTSEGLKLSGPRGESIEYSFSTGLIRGVLSPITQFEINFTSLAADEIQPQFAAWVRIAQWCLGQLPVKDERIQLPNETIQVLKRLECMEQEIRDQKSTLQTQKDIPYTRNKVVAAAELYGIGRAESLEDGTLAIFFTDGTILQVDDCASSVSYLANGYEDFHEYPLTTQGYNLMPQEVSRRLKYVTLFIQEMKKGSEL